MSTLSLPGPWRRSVTASLASALALCFWVLPGCERPDPVQGPAATPPSAVEEAPSHQQRFREAKEAAWSWADRITYDPVALERDGIDGYDIQGAKTWAELLGLYAVIFVRASEPHERERLQARVAQLAEPTRDPGFHNLDAMDDAGFSKNSMSYLRVLWLLESMGVESPLYREAAQALRPRLEAHLATRGGWQRQAFRAYYQAFSWEAPPILMAPYHHEVGPLAERLPPEQYSDDQLYYLTHTVMNATFYGYRRYPEGYFDEAERAYLAAALPALLDRKIQRMEWDISAELLSCMTYLGLREHPSAQRAAETLLDHQSLDGSWRPVESEDLTAMYSPGIDQHARLHSTWVVIKALAEVYEPTPWAR
jgi:hypothetical protein